MSARVFHRKLANELGNLPRPGAIPKFNDLEAIALNLMAESMSTDSKKYLFAMLEECCNEVPNLISRRQYQ